MPWTRRQVRYLLSSGSPLSGEQKTKMKGELHSNPSLGHKKKGSRAMKRGAKRGVERRRGNQHFESSGSRYNFRDHLPK